MIGCLLFAILIVLALAFFPFAAAFSGLGFLFVAASLMQGVKEIPAWVIYVGLAVFAVLVGLAALAPKPPRQATHCGVCGRAFDEGAQFCGGCGKAR